MKTAIKFYIAVVAVLVLCLTLNKESSGQTPAKESVNEKIAGNILLKVKAYENRIVLRWAINHSAVWLLVNDLGIKIDRIILDENNKPLSKTWETISQIPVKPLGKPSYQTLALKNQSNNSLLLGAEALFGNASIKAPGIKNQSELMDAGMEFENKYTMAMLAADMDTLTANALGQRYTDRLQVNEKYKYAYRLYLSTKAPNIFSVDTAFYMVPGSSKAEKPAPRNVQAKNKDKAIHILIPNDGVYNTFTSYNIERGTDGRHFSRINDKPLVFNRLDSSSMFLFVDSVVNHKKYYYRVNGIDAFADTSYYAPTVSGMAQNFTAPPKGYLSAVVLNGKKVKLNWIQEKYEQRPIAGFIIRKGAAMDALDKYITEKMLPASQNEFIDEKTNLVAGAYYQVLAVDTSGNYTGSNVQFVFAYDSIPPIPPIGLKATVDTTGIVKLQWNRDSNDNIQGYRIFTSNRKTASFSPISSDFVRDTLFTDTLDKSILNKEVYYRIVAVDGNNNHSAFSDIVTAIRPKLVKTPSPVIKDYSVSNGSVTLTWALPSARDRKSTKILRRLAQDTVWNTIADVPLRILSYKDSLLQESSNYEYAVVVIDENNKWSEISFPLQVFVYATDSAIPEQFSVITRDNKTTLSWNKPKKGEVAYYVIYKDGGNGLTQLEATDGKFTEFTDTGPAAKYGIKAVFKNNKTSAMVVSR